MNSDSSQQQPSIGDRYEQFVRLLVEHESQVRCYLRVLLPSWEDVDEVAQEASLVAWRKYGDFEPGTSFGGWLKTIARYEALKYRRRLAKAPMVFSEPVWQLLAEEAALDDDLDHIRREHLEECLDRLDSRKKDLLLQVYSPGAVMRDVAKQFGRSEQAFYKMIQRLRSSLLECVTKAISAEGR